MENIWKPISNTDILGKHGMAYEFVPFERLSPTVKILSIVSFNGFQAERHETHGFPRHIALFNVPGQHLVNGMLVNTCLN